MIFPRFFELEFVKCASPNKSDMNYNAYLKGFLPQPEVTGVKSFD